MWEGIRVSSHTNLPQTIANQGYVYMKNGSVIENARIGISTRGGIINAENSKFLNNFKAVEFWYYSYNQLSSFIKDTFETTVNYLDTNYSVPQNFVSMFIVKGVKFRGCTFQNTTVPSNGIPGSLKGGGIYSINSSYSVDQHEYCPSQIQPCPNPVSTQSKFKGLYYGIRVYNAEAPFTVFK